MPNVTLSADELLEKLSEQNEKIKKIREKIEKMNRENQSTFDAFAFSYYELFWWQKILVAIVVLSVAILVLTLLSLSMAFLIPLSVLYGVSTYFLSEHAEAHDNTNTETLRLLEELLTQSIDELNSLRKQLSDLLESISQLNQTLDEEAEEIETQTTHIRESHEIFKDAVESVAATAECLQSDIEQKSRGVLNSLEEVSNALNQQQDALANQTAPKLQAATSSIEKSATDMLDTQIKMQDNLARMNTCTTTLEELIEQLEAPNSPSDFSLSDDIFQRADDAASEVDELFEMAKRDLGVIPGITTPSLRFFEDARLFQDGLPSSLSLAQ